MFRGEKIFLRAFEKKDVELAHRLFNDVEVQSLLFNGPMLPLSFAEEEKIITGFMSGNPEQGWHFAIETLEGKFIGGCSYFELNRKNGTAFVSIAIANREFWGRGYGSDALKVMIKYLFHELNLRKISLRVFSFNERAIACYKKLNFQEEGRMKEQIYRDGKYHDELYMSLFRSDVK